MKWNLVIKTFFLTFFLAFLLIDGRPTKEERREARRKLRGDKEKSEETKQQPQALHQYKSVCNSKGICRYEFSLTIPISTNGMIGNMTSPDLSSEETGRQKMIGKKDLKSLRRDLKNFTKHGNEERDKIQDQLETLTEQFLDLKENFKKERRHRKKLEIELQEMSHNLSSIQQSMDNGMSNYMEDSKENITNINERMQRVEKLFYGYAADGKYVFIMKPKTPNPLMSTVVGQDCAIMRKRGLRKSGIYMIQPDPGDNSTQFYAYCDMYTDRGGWTVIQRREGGIEMFDRNWKDYKEGFGDTTGEYWLGLEKIHMLNQFGSTEIRFDMWDFKDKFAYAQYRDFRLANETDNYRIEVGRYSGTAGDAFHYGNKYLQQNRQQFTTKDRDNDKTKERNCAIVHQGSWWYQQCGVANLNGRFYEGGRHVSDQKDGIIWQPWNQQESLRRTEIKIRPSDF